MVQDSAKVLGKMNTQNLGHLLPGIFPLYFPTDAIVLESFFFFKPEEPAYQSFNHIKASKTSFPKDKIRERERERETLCVPCISFLQVSVLL